MKRITLFVLAALIMGLSSCESYNPESTGIKFDWSFESGSLGSYSYVPQLGNPETYKYIIKGEFDPENPYDKEYKEWTRWFYFRMTGVKGKTIELKFQNVGPVSPYYSYDNKEFARVSYDKEDYKTIKKKFVRDTVYLAYSKPYTLSLLEKNIERWQLQSDKFQVETIGKTALKQPLYLCTVTDKSIPDDNKKKVYIHSRIHPSETPSSEFVEDIINALLCEKQGASLENCLQKTVFYIIPMLNPDGVVEGLSRSNTKGVNLEVAYDYAPEIEQIENELVKGLLHKISEDRPIDLVLNLHSQVFNRYSFWLHTADEIGAELFDKQVNFNNICIKQDMYFDAQVHYGTMRSHYMESYIFENWGAKTLALTLELPNDYYERSQTDLAKKIVWLSDDTIEYSAERLLESIQLFLM